MVPTVTMGIIKLAELIRFEAPGAISQMDISDYTGRRPSASFIFNSLIRTGEANALSAAS